LPRNRKLWTRRSSAVVNHILPIEEERIRKELRYSAIHYS
jgi:hypothetical protein